MLRTTIAAATLACAFAASPSAEAQGFRLNIGVGPPYGYYGPTYGYRYGGGRFHDQRFYGDWRDYRSGYSRRSHYDFHAYPFPHYDAHWGRHGGHHHHEHHHHAHHRH